MTHSQKLEQEKWFKAVLNNIADNGTYIWPDAKASYKVIQGRFVPDNKWSRKVMVETTTKEFHNQFITK